MFCFFVTNNFSICAVQYLFSQPTSFLQLLTSLFYIMLTLVENSVLTSIFEVHVRMSWYLCANGISYELEIVIVLLDTYYHFLSAFVKLQKR